MTALLTRTAATVPTIARLGADAGRDRRVRLVTGLMLLGLAIVGVVLLIFDVVLGPAKGIVAAGVVAGVLLILWVVMPLVIRSGHEPES